MPSEWLRLYVSTITIVRPVSCDHFHKQYLEQNFCGDVSGIVFFVEAVAGDRL